MTREGLPTGTVTLMFTDIEGSTVLQERLKGRWRWVIETHNALLRQCFESFHGFEVKNLGDGFLVAFTNAKEAIECAVALQQAIARQDWGEEVGELKVRVGMDTGEPFTIVDAQSRPDYYGVTVSRAKRICEAGHGGQILISHATWQAVKDALPKDVEVRELGAFRLKGLEGRQQIFQVCHPALPYQFPTPRSMEAYPNNLPIALTSFIGREREMEEIKALLKKVRLVTLTGTGGCGKTRLALEVAMEVMEDFPDGVWLVELAPLKETELVVQTVASALGVKEEAQRPLLETLTDFLKPKKLLLVLDNCEHLVDACAQLVGRLLQVCPNLWVLATSREALRIVGEQIYRVPSLSVPNLTPLPSLEQLMQYESVRLFVDRARLVRPSFSVNDQNASAVAEICHRLDGIPLAIELAAALVRGLTVEQIVERLSDRFRLLTAGTRTALPRHQTLRAAIDWSYELLSRAERALFRRLSVFAGGWDLKGAEAVGTGKLPEGDEVRTEEVWELMMRLIDKSLVVMEGEMGRYQMLETLREYGRERLQEAGEAEETREKHLEFFLGLAERAEEELQGAQQREWLERLEREQDNFRVALSYGLEREPEKALKLAAALWRFWDIHSNFTEGRSWLERALEKGMSAPASVRAKALNGAGVLALRQGDYETAQALLQESLAIRQALGDQLGIASSLNNLGNVAWVQGDYERAKALYEESLTIYRTLGNQCGVASSLTNLGNIAWSRGDHEEARALYEESLTIFRKLGSQWGIASSLNSLGAVALVQGNYERAKMLLEESLAIYRDLGDQWGIAFSLNNLGNLALMQGDYERAKVLLEESLSIRRALRDQRGIAFTLYDLGSVALMQSDYERAKVLFEESLAIRRVLFDQQGIAFTLNDLGNVALAQGDYERAEALYEESLAIFQELGSQWGIANALKKFAKLAGVKGQRERAARLLGAAEALREAIGAPMHLPERSDYEQIVTELRSALGDEAFAVAWEEGRAMTLEQAIAYALEHPDA
jgi:predicted ATPase/class 3 adenylate cyclase